MLKTLSRIGLLVLALAAPAAATDIGNRFSPITSFQDERNVKVVNDNFRRVTANMIDGKLVNQVVTSTDTILNVALNPAQTDAEYAIFVTGTTTGTFRVLSKATTGYVIRFDAPGSAGHSLDAILVR